LPIAGGVTVLVLLTTIAWNYRKSLSLQETAIVVDQRLGTRNQFETLYQLREEDPWTAPVRESLKGVSIHDCRQSFSFPKSGLTLCIALPLAFWMWSFAPKQYLSQGDPGTFKEDAKEAAKFLDDEAEELEKENPEIDASWELAQEMREIAKELKELEDKNKDVKSDFGSLCKKEYVRLTIQTCAIFFICSFCYYGLTFILPQVTRL